MPFDNTTTTNGAYSAYTSPSPPAMNADAKSVDGDHLNEYNKQHSINSEDVSFLFSIISILNQLN